MLSGRYYQDTSHRFILRGVILPRDLFANLIADSYPSSNPTPLIIFFAFSRLTMDVGCINNVLFIFEDGYIIFERRMARGIPRPRMELVPEEV